MFSRNPLGRRLRHLQRRAELRLGLEDDIDLGDMVDALCGWARSMPFAEELPRPDADPLRRRFVVDCPALCCRAPWFALGTFGADDAMGPAVEVALPAPLARRGAAVGWAATVGDLGYDRTIVGIALPTGIDELRGLQGILRVAYSNAFT